MQTQRYEAAGPNFVASGALPTAKGGGRGAAEGWQRDKAAEGRALGQEGAFRWRLHRRAAPLE